MSCKTMIMIAVIILFPLFIFSQQFVDKEKEADNFIIGEYVKPWLFGNKNEIAIRIYDLSDGKYNKISLPLNSDIKYEGIEELKKLQSFDIIKVDYKEINNNKVIYKVTLMQVYDPEYYKVREICEWWDLDSQKENDKRGD